MSSIRQLPRRGSVSGTVTRPAFAEPQSPATCQPSQLQKSPGRQDTRSQARGAELRTPSEHAHRGAVERRRPASCTPLQEGRASAARAPLPHPSLRLRGGDNRCRAPTALRGDGSRRHPLFSALRYPALWPRTFPSHGGVLRTMSMKFLVLLVALLLWPSSVPADPSE